MHVDGFLLDEASVLARGGDGRSIKYPPVLWHIELNERLADTKFIAEAWDAGGLYQESGRTPMNSINFITCHDGFTLNDPVPYDRKHNEANGEENRDGSDENWSWNGCVEGRRAIQRLRRCASGRSRIFSLFSCSLSAQLRMMICTSCSIWEITSSILRSLLFEGGGTSR
jgi:glycogen operon protein